MTTDLAPVNPVPTAAPPAAYIADTAATIDRVGRRYYLRGAPFSAKNTLRNAGCNWDPDERAWWTGKKDLAEAVLEEILEAVAANPSSGKKSETVGPDDAVLNGRATYKGKSCYLLIDGHSRKDGRPYAKLCSRDGSLVFWVKDFEQFEVTKRYRNTLSFNDLKRFAEEAAEEKRRGYKLTRRGWECPSCGEELGHDEYACWECGITR